MPKVKVHPFRCSKGDKDFLLKTPMEKISLLKLIPKRRLLNIERTEKTFEVPLVLPRSFPP